MPERPDAILRVEPDAIPALRAAFADALNTLTPALDTLERDGWIPAPWMGDPISALLLDTYQRHVMEGPDSAYGHLRSYEAELRAIHDTLTVMEQTYRRTDDDLATRFGRI